MDDAEAAVVPAIHHLQLAAGCIAEQIKVVVNQLQLWPGSSARLGVVVA